MFFARGCWCSDIPRSLHVHPSFLSTELLKVSELLPHLSLTLTLAQPRCNCNCNLTLTLDSRYNPTGQKVGVKKFRQTSKQTQTLSLH